MLSTAWATTPTTATLSPRSQPWSASGAEVADQQGEGQHEQGRGQGEGEPGDQTAREARAPDTERHRELAAGRPRQQLDQRQQLGVGVLVEPALAQHEGVAIVDEMRRRAAEGSPAQPVEGARDLDQPLPTLGHDAPWRPARDPGA